MIASDRTNPIRGDPGEAASSCPEPERTRIRAFIRGAALRLVPFAPSRPRARASRCGFGNVLGIGRNEPNDSSPASRCPLQFPSSCRNEPNRWDSSASWSEPITGLSKKRRGRSPYGTIVVANDLVHPIRRAGRHRGEIHGISPRPPHPPTFDNHPSRSVISERCRS